MAGILMAAAMGLITAGYCAMCLVKERQAGQALMWSGVIVLLLIIVPSLWHAMMGRAIGTVLNRQRSSARTVATRVGLYLFAVVISGLAVWINQGYGRSRYEGFVPVSAYLRLAVAGVLIQIAILTLAQLRRTGGLRSWQSDRNR